MALRPHTLKVAQGIWGLQSVPIVGNVEQLTAFAAGNQSVPQVKCRPAARRNALLKGDVRLFHGT